LFEKTGVQLELLSDTDMLLMFEKGIRGGVSMISTRYSKSNNVHMGLKYYLDEESKFIQYLEANNFYGWAKSKPPYPFVISSGCLKVKLKIGDNFQNKKNAFLRLTLSICKNYMNFTMSIL